MLRDSNKENKDPFNMDEISNSIKLAQKQKDKEQLNKQENTICKECNQQFPQNKEDEHKEICQRDCEYCKELYPSELIKEHYQFCEEKEKFKHIKLKLSNDKVIQYPDIFDIVLIHEQQKFWNIQFTAFKTRIVCGKIGQDNQKEFDKNECIREHQSIQQLTDYITNKVNQKIERGYILEVIESEESEKGVDEEIHNESDMSFTEQENFDIKQSTTLRKFKFTEEKLKEPTEGIPTFQGDHKIIQDTCEWALLIALYSLLLQEGKKKEFWTKYEIRDQINLLNFSFEIKIKKDYVYLFLRTDLKYLTSQTQGDEEFFGLTDIGKSVAKTLYDQKMMEIDILEQQYKQNVSVNKKQNQQTENDEDLAKKLQEEENKKQQQNNNNNYSDSDSSFENNNNTYNKNNNQNNMLTPNQQKQNNNNDGYKIKLHSSERQKQIENQNKLRQSNNYQIFVSDTNYKGKLLSTQEKERKKQLNQNQLFVAQNDQFVYDQNSELSIRDLTDLSMGPSRNVSQQNSLNNSVVSTTHVLGKNCSKPYNVLLAEKWKEGVHDPQNYMMSEKMDGVRGVWTGKQLYSRNQKRFFPPKFFTQNWPNCMLDGELWTARDDFSKCVSYVKKKSPIDSEWEQVRYIVYDCPGLDKPFKERIKLLAEEIGKLDNKYIICHPHVMCRGQKHLDDNLKDVLDQGGEGLMMREINSFYINRRSETLLKVKVFQDEEAVVIGHLPGEGRNAYVTGSLQCRNGKGVVFKVGSGLNDELRRKPPKIGSKITYKFQGLSKNGKPRFPTFLRICPQL